MDSQDHKDLKPYKSFNIKYILKPWYFTGFSTLLALFITIISIVIINQLKDNLYQTRYLNDKLKEDVIVTERDNQLKTMAMYNLIISTYGNKYHKNYNHGKKRKFQGLEPRWQWPLFVRKCYEYEQRLGIPYMTLMTFAKIETAFNPLAETSWEDGEIKEAGIFQNRSSAVDEACKNLKLLYAVNPKLAMEFEFEYKNMKSLFDPLNALKIEALLVWGAMQNTANQMVWWSTMVHWGSSRIYPYYSFRKNDGILPDDFSFNKGTIKEDVRDPLQYFGLFYANWGQFSKFKIKVNVEQWYDELYREECSKLEWQFIQSWKYVKELKEGVEDLREFQLEAKQEHEKQLNKILEKSRKINQEYLKLHGRLKAGKFINAKKDIFLMWKVHFKELVYELGVDEKVNVTVAGKTVTFGKAIIILYLVGLLLLFLFSGFGVSVIVYLVVKKIKNIRRKHVRNNQ